LQTIYVLLSRKSEQERRLLSALVNKVSYLTLSYDSFETFDISFDGVIGYKALAQTLDTSLIII
jgi:hypothetical protein